LRAASDSIFGSRSFCHEKVLNRPDFTASSARVNKS
jgi:hypothetical protein